MKVEDEIRLHEVLRALEDEATERNLDLIIDRVNDILEEVGFFDRVEREWEDALLLGRVDTTLDDIPF